MVIARCAFLLMLCWCATAAAETARVFTEIRLTDDSDDQSQSDVAAGYQSAQTPFGAGSYWATSVGHRRLWSADDSESLDYLRLDGRSPLSTNAGLSARLDLNHGEDWSPTLGALAVDWSPAKAWRLEASTERDLVDTVVAVRNRTRMDTQTFAVDLAIHPTVTAVAAVGYSAFNDGNDRLHRIARVIWSPSRWQWINLQLRGKRADSDASGAGYFNPRRLEEYEAQIRLAGSPFGERWVVSLMAGTGQQRINGDNPSSIYALESRVRGWFNDHYGLEGSAACSNVGSLSVAASQDDYRMCQLGIQFIASW